jgi:hypothetical protein
MERLTEHKIVLIVRNTRIDDLVIRFNTLSQAQFYVEHLGADFSDYLAEHNCYHKVMRLAEDQLKRVGRVQVVHRSFLPNFVFGEGDTVVVLGQDGLVANTVKYLAGQAVIGVNPDPARWDGVLLPFVAEDLAKILPDVWANRRSIKQVTMAQATLNNGQSLYGVNDLFIGPRSHTSARYSIRVGKRQEIQSSSGIIVSTGLGSTGWFSSVLTGALGIASQVAETPLRIPERRGLAWDTPYLRFSVREPFPSKATAVSLVFGKITADEPMTLVSQMPDYGVIFSDGIEADFLEFNSGTKATITIADKHGNLVV